MSRIDCSLNYSPLYITVSRNVVSVFEISAVNLIAGSLNKIQKFMFVFVHESLVTILDHQDEAQGNNKMVDNESSLLVSMKVQELQNFLKVRDILEAVDGKKRKRAELLKPCKSAAEMKIPKVDEETELQDDLINSKITLPGGKLLPHPLSLQFWTHNCTHIPDFTFPDIYHYLVGKDGYDEA